MMKCLYYTSTPVNNDRICSGVDWAPLGPLGKNCFAAILALFKLAWKVGVGPLKWWAPGHCPNAHRSSPPLFFGSYRFKWMNVLIDTKLSYLATHSTIGLHYICRKSVMQGVMQELAAYNCTSLVRQLFSSDMREGLSRNRTRLLPITFPKWWVRMARLL